MEQVGHSDGFTVNRLPYILVFFAGSLVPVTPMGPPGPITSFCGVTREFDLDALFRIITKRLNFFLDYV